MLRLPLSALCTCVTQDLSISHWIDPIFFLSDSKTTRSRTNYKGMDETNHHHRRCQRPPPPTPADDGLSDLTRMMQKMLEDCRLREAEIQECMKECMKGICEQIEGLQQLITGTAALPHHERQESMTQPPV